MTPKQKNATFFAIPAAALYALNAPMSKLLLGHIPPTMMAGFLYLGAGLGSLIIALLIKENFPKVFYILMALLLGFIAYGLSIFFYIHAQRELGAAKTSAYYAVAPFIGVVLSLVLFWEAKTVSFIVALLIMIAGTYLAATDV